MLMLLLMLKKKKKKQNLLLAADAALLLEARRERDKDGLLVGGAYTHGARLLALAIATVEKQIAFSKQSLRKAKRRPENSHAQKSHEQISILRVRFEPVTITIIAMITTDVGCCG